MNFPAIHWLKNQRKLCRPYVYSAVSEWLKSSHDDFTCNRVAFACEGNSKPMSWRDNSLAVATLHAHYVNVYPSVRCLCVIFAQIRKNTEVYLFFTESDQSNKRQRQNVYFIL